MNEVTSHTGGWVGFIFLAHSSEHAWNLTVEEDCKKGGRCSRCHSFSSRLEESWVLLENGDVLSLEHPQRVRIGCLLFTLPSVINGCSLSAEGAVLASSCAVYSTALAPWVRWFSLQNGHAKRFRLNTGLACLGGCAQEKKMQLWIHSALHAFCQGWK